VIQCSAYRQELVADVFTPCHTMRYTSAQFTHHQNTSAEDPSFRKDHPIKNEKIGNSSVLIQSHRIKDYDAAALTSAGRL
jgi:hypothetical protein